jgi:hypothetical protein
MNKRVMIFAVVIILALLIPVTTSCYASMTNPHVPLLLPIRHSMTIRIGVIGIPDVDPNQIIWNLEPEIRPNIQTNHSPQGLSSITYGSTFTMKYEIVPVSTATTSAFKDYLKSISKTEIVPPYFQGNPSTSPYYYQNKYTTLDAARTEDWLNAHISDFGGIPDDGYLLIVADLSDISNLYHYYSMEYRDLDKASAQATYANDPTVTPIVDWMYSWGGRHSFYFIDLSGGDPDFDFSQTGHVPIQDFTRSISGQPVDLSRNDRTLNEYVADYVSEAVRNLFLPDYAYAPTFATSYRIVVHIFDETGRISKANVDDYLSTSVMKSVFKDLVPYATWNVSLITHQLRDDAGLAKTVSDSLAFSRVYRSQGRLNSMDYYDYRQVYSYLQSHLDEYVDTTGDTVVLPVFDFVFKNGARFADAQKDDVGSSKYVDSPVGTFVGVSLGDLVIIGSSDMYLFDNGVGLTHDTIHELGHSMGCMHPHSFGQTQDYVSSVMSYATYEYAFSQFDVDAIQRAHADRLLSETKDAGSQQAKAAYEDALLGYSKKDYSQAVRSLQGFTTSRTPERVSLPEWLLTNGFVVGVAVGIMIGIVATVALLRRKKPVLVATMVPPAQQPILEPTSSQAS